MTIFVLIIHTIGCILLVTVVLMQSGRGGGLTEGFSSAETMLGAHTNEFMVKATTFLSVLFLITCLSLAFLSVSRNRSLMADVPVEVAPVTENLDGAASPQTAEPESQAAPAQAPVGGK